MALLIRYTDPAQIGSPVIALVLNESGQIWDDVALAFTNPPRTVNHEIALTEQSPNFPGLHQATVAIPSDTEGLLLIRFEEDGDATKTPIGTATSTAGGSTIVLADFLNVIVPNTDTGSGDITVGQLFEEVLAAGKGRFKIDRIARTATFYHLDDTVMRTLNIVNDQSESSRNPP